MQTMQNRVFNAIRDSILQDRIVNITVSDLDSFFSELEEFADDYDRARLPDGSFDVWGTCAEAGFRLELKVDAE